MLISIIIPVYNVENYLTYCLDSILNQTFQDYEVIMINDGSTDRSPDICEEYSKKDSRYKTLHKENGGQSTARNQGVKIAKGDYLMFIDSDDFLTNNNCLQIIFNGLRTSPDVLAYRYYKYFSSRHKSDCGINMSSMVSLDKFGTIKELVKRDSFFCSCWSKVVKRSLIIKNGITFDESLSCEDMDWYFNVISYSKTVEVIDYPVINYRQREGSVTSGGFKPKNIKDFIFTIKKWRENFDNIERIDEKYVLLSALAKLYCNLLISYSSNRSKALSMRRDIFVHKSLLNYDLNPRTRKFKVIVRLIGLNAFTRILNLYSKLK